MDHPTVAASAVRAIGARVRGGIEGIRDQLALALMNDWLAVAGSVAALAEQSTNLGRDFREGGGPRVLCHGDAHIANVVVGGRVWLIDWDGVALAPPERDLMFLFGGVIADAPVTHEQRSCCALGRWSTSPALPSRYWTSAGARRTSEGGAGRLPRPAVSERNRQPGPGIPPAAPSE